MDKTALKVAGIIFLVVALAHLARLVSASSVALNGREIPLWTSGVAFPVMLVLALWMFRAGRAK